MRINTDIQTHEDTETLEVLANTHETKEAPAAFGYSSIQLDDQGQSTLEFALTLVMLMSFTFFFVQLTFVFAFGNYAHYATFMAARTLLSSRQEILDQTSAAAQVAKKMLKRSNGRDLLPNVAQSVGGGAGGVSGLEIESSPASAGGAELSWRKGVRYTFRSRVFTIPMGRANRTGGTGPNTVNSVTLTSESWLGREATESECQNDLRSPSADGGQQLFLVDNGC